MTNSTKEITSTFENEIITASREFKVRWTEVLVTLVALVAGVVLFCFNMIDLISLSIIVFGALWNFFTDSNKLFACIMSFFMCIVYGFLAGAIKVYGHAFLHIMFYLPTQLIYYYESQKSESNAVRHDKSLTRAGYIGTVVCGWLVAFGLGIVLCKIGDPYYLVDAVSSTLLIVSVFLVNGKYREYYFVRLSALLVAFLAWLYIGIKLDFGGNTLTFMLLFTMYFVMDTIEYFRWKKRDPKIAK